MCWQTTLQVMKDLALSFSAKDTSCFLLLLSLLAFLSFFQEMDCYFIKTVITTALRVNVVVICATVAITTTVISTISEINIVLGIRRNKKLLTYFNRELLHFLN